MRKGATSMDGREGQRQAAKTIIVRSWLDGMEFNKREGLVNDDFPPVH